MIKKIKQKIYSFFSEGHSRTILAKKNIAISFFIKGASIVIGLLLVPMTINYVSSMQYGIWLTISSLIGWMSFFDIGMGNGLRNKLAESLALNEFQLAKIYVSTTYACLLIISLGLFVFFCFLNPYIDWQTFLNIPESVKDDISLAVLIIFGSFCVQFVGTIMCFNHYLHYDKNDSGKSYGSSISFNNESCYNPDIGQLIFL